MGQQDLTIQELVNRIERGDIRLPEMQRQYVWRATRVRDLLDSLYRGYPSGTILTWEPDEDVETRTFAIAQAGTGRRRFQLLLDGQQRLTALSAVIRGEHVHVRGRKRPIDILFNLEHPEDLQVITEVHEDKDEDAADEEISDASEDELMKRFEQMTFVVYSTKLAKLPHWVSVTEVFKENSDKPFLKKANVTSMDDPRYDKYTARLKRLRDIRHYGYRVHILDQDRSYGEVTEIFVRVNSLGAKLRRSDLALAQLTEKWRGSLKIFQEFEEECKKHGFNFDLSTHLRNLVAFAAGQCQFHVIGGLTRQDIQEAWDECQKGMLFAVNFLRANVGIDNLSLLNSPFLVLVIASLGSKQDYRLSPVVERQLRYWTLLANMKGRYSRGSTETYLDQDLAVLGNENQMSALIEFLETQTGARAVRPIDLQNRSSRSPYFKTMFLAFREAEAKDWNDQLVISLQHAGTQHAPQFHHIFPRAILKNSGYTTSQINDICNLAFINGRTNRKIRDRAPAEYLPEIIDRVGPGALSKQCIPDDPDLWRLEAYEDFLEARRQLVAERLNEFLGHEEMAESL